MKARRNSTLNIARFSVAVVFGFAFILSSLTSFGQAESPYSRYGLGFVRNPVFSANQGMGYLSAPYASAENINYSNPASYASLTRTTIEIGVLADGSNIRVADSNYRTGNGSVNHFAITLVPAAKKCNWAVSLGMLPYTNVNYNFIQTINDPSIGQYAQSFIGSGSLYKAYVGGAAKTNGFSIGANLEYIFGKVTYQKVISFPNDSFASYATQNVTNLNVSGFNYNVGVMYQRRIYHNRDSGYYDSRHDVYMYLGAYGNGGMSVTGKTSTYWERSIYSTSTSTQTVVDTLQYFPSQSGKIKLPYQVGAGVMFGNELFWLLGADFKYNGWGTFNTIGNLDNGGLANSWQFSVGGQIMPKYDGNYFMRMKYRVGMYYGKSEIVASGNQLNQGGATLGVSFPLLSKLDWAAHLNFMADFGTLGYAGNKNLPQESYYKFSLGFVINNIWFRKASYD